MSEINGMIMVLQATARQPARDGERQRRGERTLALTYARVVGSDKTIKVEPPCGTARLEEKRMRDDWADK